MMQNERDLAVIANFRPYLEAEFDKIEREIDTKTIAKLNKGELLAEHALQAWAEKAAIRRLRSRFSTNRLTNPE